MISYAMICAAPIIAYVIIEFVKAKLRIHFLNQNKPKETKKIIESTTIKYM